MPDLHQRTCPRCGRPLVRLQRSGPAGTDTGDFGPVVAYPCQCWMPADHALAIVLEVRGRG